MQSLPDGRPATLVLRRCEDGTVHRCRGDRPDPCGDRGLAEAPCEPMAPLPHKAPAQPRLGHERRGALDVALHVQAVDPGHQSRPVQSQNASPDAPGEHRPELDIGRAGQVVCAGRVVRWLGEQAEVLARLLPHGVDLPTAAVVSTLGQGQSVKCQVRRHPAGATLQRYVAIATQSAARTRD